MKLGIQIEWAGTQVDVPVEKIRLAESLGFDSVWSGEAYGSDALTPLAFIAAQTQRIKLGTSIAQVSARPPTAAAMAFATLDQLAGSDRAICGLGLSGPQVVEGWYGQAWDKPRARLRDYVAIMKQVLHRQGPLNYQGEAIAVPLPTEFGKPLKSILHTNPALPIYLATGSRAMVELTAEIADGWIPFGFDPDSMQQYRPWLEAGFARAGGQRCIDDLAIQAPIVTGYGDDVQAEIDKQKPMTAFYVGGMGHAKKNFHKDRMVRAGFAEAADDIQQLFLAGRRDEAIAAVPDEYIDNSALLGPKARIREKLQRWESSGVTGLTLTFASDEMMRIVAEYFDTIP